ncbi:HTH-type transcriptional regulator BetI [Roseovarius albus]|uniref:HTH-type transcriptional regulator BetI n=1 Tax=Roseovarius albus TaxID=1247867 RepID=A0A1X6Z7N1_9RHOB|nr:TetR/AcrR family transcriptional regulator [Roseovarius albus]SLN42953.1 HTH-type transcriptional regulator BetI [Roseovarius albus]
MSENEPKFRREPAQQRKEALIEATLTLIAEQGIRGATVREIAKRAEVTQGLIRHYFSSKEELISAAYEYHMKVMTQLTEGTDLQANTSGKTRLVRFVESGLTPPVVDPRAVSLWAGFLNKVRADAQMFEIHEQTYHDFRGRLEALIGEALNEANILITPPRLRSLAIACNAVMDGLWMEGGALPDAFEPEELPRIGLESISAIIGLELTQTTEGQS